MKETSLFENKLREQLNMEIERNKAISRLAFNVIVGDFVFFFQLTLRAEKLPNFELSSSVKSSSVTRTFCIKIMKGSSFSGLRALFLGVFVLASTLSEYRC